jgi:CubicO group peptidase (beta-lactamase class C family)
MSENRNSPIAALRPYIQSGALAGAVTLVASKDQILSLEAIGCADLAARKPIKTDQMFWIASMTKPMAASLLMMLVDEQKVDLDAPVEKYLPGFKGQMVETRRDDQHVLLSPLDRPITVTDVLRHTSGLPFLSRLETKIDIISLREAGFAAALTNLVSQPGTKYLYSNCGMNVVGRIVEVASGLPFAQFLDQRLLRPLKMTDTTFWPSDAQVARLAKTYKPNAQNTHLEEAKTDFLTYPLQDRSRHVHPGGGLFSTATDVSQFCRMILNGGSYNGRQFLSPASIRRMTTTQTGNLPVDSGPPGGGYGLGWLTTRADPGNTTAALVGKCGHGGALATRFWIHPDHGIATIYLVQHQGYAGPDGDKIDPAFVDAALEAFGK